MRISHGKQADLQYSKENFLHSHLNTYLVMFSSEIDLDLDLDLKETG